MEEERWDHQLVMRFADQKLLASLVALLPPFSVNVREGESLIVMLHVRSNAAAMIERALVNGHTLDRTNGDGPIADWDGWLVIEIPEPGKSLFLQIATPGGGKLA